MILRKTMYFLTAEDITRQRHDMNCVVYNYTLPIERRMEMFVNEMKKISPHVFTPDELAQIRAMDNPMSAKKLLQLIWSFIYKPIMNIDCNSQISLSCVHSPGPSSLAVYYLLSIDIVEISPTPPCNCTMVYFSGLGRKKTAGETPLSSFHSVSSS